MGGGSNSVSVHVIPYNITDSQWKDPYNELDSSTYMAWQHIGSRGLNSTKPI